MKFIICLASILTTSCANNLTDDSGWFKKATKTEVHQARVTYYSVGQDKWGDKVACPKTYRAKAGVTVAAHPDFKFGTRLYIPGLKDKVGDGHFLVQDRGSWVTSKKAAKGKTYVFDVFTNSPKERKKHAYNRPMYMEVHVLKEQ